MYKDGNGKIRYLKNCLHPVIKFLEINVLNLVIKFVILCRFLLNKRNNVLSIWNHMKLSKLKYP